MQPYTFAEHIAHVCVIVALAAGVVWLLWDSMKTITDDLAQEERERRETPAVKMERATRVLRGLW